MNPMIMDDTYGIIESGGFLDSRIRRPSVEAKESYRQGRTRIWLHLNSSLVSLCIIHMVLYV